MSEPQNLRAVGDRLEQLFDVLQAEADPRSRELAEELVRLVTELYGAALERVVELAREKAPAFVASIADDELIAHWARRGRVTGSPFPHDKVVPGLALPLGVIGVTARAPAHYVYELRLREPIRSAQTETPPCSRH